MKAKDEKIRMLEREVGMVKDIAIMTSNLVKDIAIMTSSLCDILMMPHVLVLGLDIQIVFSSHLTNGFQHKVKFY